jgi:hypothetical protein
MGSEKDPSLGTPVCSEEMYKELGAIVQLYFERNHGRASGRDLAMVDGLSTLPADLPDAGREEALMNIIGIIRLLALASLHDIDSLGRELGYLRRILEETDPRT